MIEAKPVGTTLSGVEWQSAMYAEGLPADVRLAALTKDGRLPFVFEASGTETHFTNGYDPDPRARRIFNFPQPETLARVLRDAEADPEHPTWRAKVARPASPRTAPLRPAQIEAINGIEQSLAEQRFDRSLVQMATGAGKTYTAVTESYRLLKYGGFNRILFLVDRNNLADQTLAEFQNYRTPDDGRRFTELYNVAKLSSAGMLGSTQGRDLHDPAGLSRFLQEGEVTDTDDPGLDDFVPDTPVTVAYSDDAAARDVRPGDRRRGPPLDLRRVARRAGVLRRPRRRPDRDARQADLRLLPAEPRLRVHLPAVGRRRGQRRLRHLPDPHPDQRAGLDDRGRHHRAEGRPTHPRAALEALDEDLEYTAAQLDRAVTATDQIRTVLETFRDRLFTEIFPGRSTVPKTLIFAKDDNHAEEIVTQVREVFGKGNDFAAKITYSARNAKAQLQAFRTCPTPAHRGHRRHDRHRHRRQAAGVRVLHARRPVSAVLRADEGPRRPHHHPRRLPGRHARRRDQDPLRHRRRGRGHRARLRRAAAEPREDRQPQEAARQGSRPDPHRGRGGHARLPAGEARARAAPEPSAPNSTRSLATCSRDRPPARRRGRPRRQAEPSSVDDRSGPSAADRRASSRSPRTPSCATASSSCARTHDRVIDEVSRDVLLDADGVVDTARARSIVESWRSLPRRASRRDHRDPARSRSQERRIDFGDIQELADRIARPPYNWTPDVIWKAYEAIEAPNVRTSSATHATDLVSLMRYTVGADDELVPYAERVRERYAGWLAQQEQAGVTFTDTERWWLDRMVSVIANSAGIRVERPRRRAVHRTWRHRRRAPRPRRPSCWPHRRAERGVDRMTWASELTLTELVRRRAVLRRRLGRVEGSGPCRDGATDSVGRRGRRQLPEPLQPMAARRSGSFPWLHLS